MMTTAVTSKRTLGAGSVQSEFQDFFLAEADHLKRLATFLVGDAEQGADLAQEALVRAYRHWGRIRNEDPGPYTRRILVNLVCSAHRRRVLAAEPVKSHLLKDRRAGSRTGCSSAAHSCNSLRFSAPWSCSVSTRTWPRRTSPARSTARSAPSSRISIGR